MTPTTKAGQGFLDWWQGRTHVTVTLDWALVSVAAIEAEARQQERERIVKWFVDEQIHHPDSWVIAELRAILADEPQP